MHSKPPATTTSLYPKPILYDPNTIVFMPEAQTLLTLMQGTLIGIPAPREAYLAGLCPNPEGQTIPKITSSTYLGSSLIDDKAALIAIDPNSVALTLESLPIKEPIGVLFPATI